MNKQKFLESFLSISTREKKHEFLQQLTSNGPLPIRVVNIQCQCNRETDGQIADLIVTRLKLKRTGKC